MVQYRLRAVPMHAVAAIGVLGTLLAGAGCGGSATKGAAPSTPVAEVDGRPIARVLFDLRVRSALTAISQGGGLATGAAAGAMNSQVRAGVMRSLIIDAEIARLAQRRGVAATDAAVEHELGADMAAAGGQTQLDTQLSAAGGSTDQLRDEIRSRLNESALEDVLAQDRAHGAMNLLATGASFAVVVRQYSDDTNSASHGGDLGAVPVTQLATEDPRLGSAVAALTVGARTAAPIRDRAGYDIVQLDARRGDTVSLHRILVAAPDPYTVRERPAWFGEAIFAAIQSDCEHSGIRVYLDATTQPCKLATSPSPSTPSTPTTPTAPPSPSTAPSPTVAMPPMAP